MTSENRMNFNGNVVHGFKIETTCSSAAVRLYLSTSRKKYFCQYPYIYPQEKHNFKQHEPAESQ